jgi:hypothetical protein
MPRLPVQERHADHVPGEQQAFLFRNLKDCHVLIEKFIVITCTPLGNIVSFVAQLNIPLSLDVFEQRTGARHWLRNGVLHGRMGNRCRAAKLSTNLGCCIFTIQVHDASKSMHTRMALAAPGMLLMIRWKLFGSQLLPTALSFSGPFA